MPKVTVHEIFSNREFGELKRVIEFLLGKKTHLKYRLMHESHSAIFVTKNREFFDLVIRILHYRGDSMYIDEEKHKL